MGGGGGGGRATEYTTGNQALIFCTIECTEDFEVIRTTINHSPPVQLYFSMNVISFMFSQPNLGRALKFQVSQARSIFGIRKL